jgi:hypothetical protein
MRVCALAYLPTGTDVPFGSDSLKLRVQFIALRDECVAGHALMPLGAQPLNHFRKPLRIPAAMMEPSYCAKRVRAKAALCNIIGQLPSGDACTLAAEVRDADFSLVWIVPRGWGSVLI